MKHSLVFGSFWAFSILLSGSLVASYGFSLPFYIWFDCSKHSNGVFRKLKWVLFLFIAVGGPLYDFTAYTEVKQFENRSFIY